MIFQGFSKYIQEEMILELTQVQKSKSKCRNEIIVRSNSPLSTQSIESSTNTINTLDLPIAIRKGIRECIRTPFYPLSHYFSLKHMSLAHKKLIINLNTIAIPNIIFEAF